MGKSCLRERLVRGRVRPARPFLRLRTSRGFGKTCAVVCAEVQGCLPCEGAGCCREGGTAACAFRNNARAHAQHSSFPTRRSSPPGQALSRIKRQTVRTKHNTFPWRREKSLRSARLALKRYFCSLCPLSGCSSWSQGGPQPPDPPLGPCEMRLVRPDHL